MYPLGDGDEVEEGVAGRSRTDVSAGWAKGIIERVTLPELAAQLVRHHRPVADQVPLFVPSMEVSLIFCCIAGTRPTFPMCW